MAARAPRKHATPEPRLCSVRSAGCLGVGGDGSALGAAVQEGHGADLVPGGNSDASDRRGRYVPLLHITLLVALLVHLRGLTDVTAVFCTAMFGVYVDHGVRKHEPRPRRMQIMAMCCVFSVNQIVISLLVDNETIRIVNTCGVALLAMHFALTK